MVFRTPGEHENHMKRPTLSLFREIRRRPKLDKPIKKPTVNEKLQKKKKKPQKVVLHLNVYLYRTVSTIDFFL